MENIANWKKRVFFNRAVSDANKEAMLAELATVWKQVPHLRLGQLLVCAALEQVRREDVETWLFYVEDAALIEAVARMVTRYKDLGQE